MCRIVPTILINAKKSTSNFSAATSGEDIYLSKAAKHFSGSGQLNKN
jgi:hypothetical protein